MLISKFLTLCSNTEAFLLDAIFVLVVAPPPAPPPPPPVADAVRVDVFGVFLGFFGILTNFCLSCRG